MEEKSSVPQKQKTSALEFLGIGLFELGFVAFIFLLLFGTLNYFNILMVSEVFPNQFGWLPRQTQTKTAPKNVVSAPFNFTSDTFQYDTKKAETFIAQYAKDTLKPDILPTKIDVKQGLTINGRTEGMKNEFGSTFTSNNSNIAINFHYRENFNTPNDYFISIQPNNITEATATATLANTLLSSYFSKPYPISNCQTNGTFSSCENLQTLNEGKRGYGISLINTGSKIISIVYNCFIPKESTDYETTKRCVMR